MSSGKSLRSSPKSSDRDPAKICGAKRRAGGTCCAYACRGRSRCKIHGGLSPCGVASPHWVHGRSSRYANKLSADDQDDFQEALAAPDPLSLLEEIALVRTLLMGALQGQLDTGALRSVLVAARAALAAEDTETAGNRVEDALALLDGSRPVDDALLTRHMGLLKGLVDTSARVIDIRANSFSRIQTTALISRLVELIAGNVREPQDRKRLLTVLAHLSAEVAPASLTTSRKSLE